MTDIPIHDDLLALLKDVDTPTVCNAIEVAQGRRGFASFTRETMVCSDPSGGAIVGYARTARIAGAEPPGEPVDVIRERRMAYYRHWRTARTRPSPRWKTSTGPIVPAPGGARSMPPSIKGSASLAP